MPADPLDVLAGSISVSQGERMPRATLEAILLSGRFEPGWTGHVMALVDEAPLLLLARAVGSYPPARRPAVLDGLQAVARAVGSARIARWMAG